DARALPVEVRSSEPLLRVCSKSEALATFRLRSIPREGSMNRRVFAGLAGFMFLFALGGSATAAHGPAVAPQFSQRFAKLPERLPAHGQRNVCSAAVLGLAH